MPRKFATVADAILDIADSAPVVLADSEGRLWGIGEVRRGTGGEIILCADEPYESPIDELVLSRAGHRIEGPHDCVEANCSYLGEEVLELRRILASRG